MHFFIFDLEEAEAEEEPSVGDRLTAGFGMQNGMSFSDAVDRQDEEDQGHADSWLDRAWAK